MYYTAMYQAMNPFHYGDLALDEAFTDREDEVAELQADMRNGQNVVVFAPRRYGKSSLVLRAAENAVGEGVLIGYCDLMTTPTKERFAAALAKTIHEDLSSAGGQMLERAAALFRGLRVMPSMEIDPSTGGIRFTFDAARRKRSGDIDDTIARLLELPQDVAGERGRRTVLILDEFQEVVKLDPQFPNLMRSVFQRQPEVGHVYLGSRRHVLERIFNDRNEPFWRSAKRMEIGAIPRPKFAPFIKVRFQSTNKEIEDAAVERLLNATGGHPYATQELAYATWERVPEYACAYGDDVEEALVKVLRSEHNHFARIWEDATEHQRLLLLALAADPGAPYSRDYQQRHDLESSSHVQRALSTLLKEELVGQSDDGTYRLIEPFFGDWLQREQQRPRGVREIANGLTP